MESGVACMPYPGEWMELDLFDNVEEGRLEDDAVGGLAAFAEDARQRGRDARAETVAPYVDAGPRRRLLDRLVEQ